ncbi:MAG: hypothetical protein AMXMBFR84_17040 [Candidatus Hydrogenedentota bacterium]
MCRDFLPIGTPIAFTTQHLAGMGPWGEFPFLTAPFAGAVRNAGLGDSGKDGFMRRI